MLRKNKKKEHTLSLIQACFHDKSSDLDLSKCDLSGDDFARSLLAQCTWLKKLTLPQAAKADELGRLDFLTRFSQLESLCIHGDYVPESDFGFLAGLPLLNNLTLRIKTAEENEPLDFGFLAACPQLEILDICFSNLEALPNFPSLPNLWQLNLRCNAIEGALILPLLPALESINIGHNYIDNIDSLLACGQLREIWADDNLLTNLPDLSQLPKLEAIDFSENKINKINISAPCPRLKTMHLGENLIADIAPLSACMGLESLNIYYNPIADLRPLLSLANLKILYAMGCLLPTPPPAALIFISKNWPLGELLGTVEAPAEIDKIWPLLHSPDTANQDLAELLAVAAQWPNATLRAYFNFSR
jgi:hypothetical protein